MIKFVLAGITCVFSFQMGFAGDVKLRSKYERWAENEEAELKSISSLIKFGSFMQDSIATASGMPKKRGAHAKGTCSAVSLTMEDFDQTSYDSIRAKLNQFSFFKNQSVYNGVARLSNGSPRTQADTVPDARGLAVEVDVSEGVVQDFIMINHPVFFTDNAADYLKFQQLSAKAAGKKDDDVAAFNSFMQSRPRLAQNIGAILGKKVSSYLSTQYWTGHAYKFGPDDVVKYSAIPCGGVVAGVPDGAMPNYLQDDFKNKVAQPDGACFELHIQFVDVEQSPFEEVQKIVEDPTVELTTPLYKIATLNLHGPLMTEEQCEGLKFNPVHRTIPGMEGIGGIARIRGAVYDSSQQTRLAK